MMAAAGQARKTVTVLFCDVTGSTALGERLDPESLREVIHRYFTDMRAVIERHGGTVEKFIGDAVMAVFGVPRVHEDDALRAVRAAADMQSALAGANERFEHDFGVRIHARIGINTGEVIAGDPGSAESFVSGDPVNIAARLEQAAEPGEVLLGKSTYRLVRAAVIAEPLSPLAAKGKSEPLSAYRMVVVEPKAEMLPRRLDAPLVGRRSELADLRSSFDEAASGPACRLVTLIGEAGVGKSRLAHELLTSVDGTAHVLRGRCLPYGEGITFWPVTEILEEAAGIGSGDSPEEARSKVEQLLPPEHDSLRGRLATILGLGETAGAIQETFLAVRRCLEHLGRRRPVVVVFDDIHWAEDTFLDLVQYLSSFVLGSPLFLLCLARPELLEVRPDWPQLGPMIRLHALDAASSEAFVMNLLGEGGSSGDLAATIARATAGNPLFIEETLRMLVDQKLLARREDHWFVTCDLGELAAPDTVHAVIAARLDRLEPGERAILQSASVVGEVFWWGAVASLSAEDKPIDVGHGLQALVRKDLIRPDPSAFFGEDAFRFGHLLIRDVAYESLPKKSRAGLHARLSRWIDERAGGRTAEYDEIIGYHAERAHQYLAELAPADEHSAALANAAAERLASAGQRGLERGDVSAAANLLARAVALRQGDDPERSRLLKSLGDALAESTRLDEAEAVLREAIDGARVLGDRRLEQQAIMRLAFITFHRSAEVSHEFFLDTVRDAEAVFEGIGDPDGVAEAMKLRGIVHLWGGRCGAALEVFERGLEHASRGADRRRASDLRHWMCLALTEGLTQVPEAAERIAAFLRGGDVDRQFAWRTRRYLAELEAMRGRFVEARVLLDEAIALARELGLELELASGLLRNSGYVALLAGELEGAEADLRRAVEILVQAGDKGHLASCAPDLAHILLERTDRDREALAMAELGEASSIEDDVDAQTRWRAAKARALCRLGDPEEAERLARSSVERAWKTDYAKLRAHSQEALADVLYRTGRKADAVEALTVAISVYDQKGNLASAAAARTMLAAYESSAGASGSRGR